jgi:hypothetical protein
VSGRTIVLLGVACAAAGCESHTSVSPPDGGPPLALDVLDPPGSQIGLRYGASVDLRVRYRLDDASRAPLGGQTVRFSIFGDPQGSTLSSDRATTGDDGVATITLAAGAAEASFSVRASAPRTPDAEFSISVSRLEFVALEVELAYPDAAVLRAALYDDRPCAALAPSPTPPAAFRSLSRPGPSASLPFVNLLSLRYALVGRAEDAMGHLVAAGCADLDPGLLPPGSSATLPLPLARVLPSPLGAYQLTTTLTRSARAVTGAWHALADCPEAPAEVLLDAIEAAAPSVRGAFEARRAPPDANGCRGALPGGAASLDQQLHALLTPAGAPATQLGAIVADLDAIVGGARLGSTLTVAAGPASVLTGEHVLGALTLAATGGKSATYDLAASGVPIIDARDVPLTFDSEMLSIGAHGFTLRLPLFWRRAFNELAIAPRFPTLASPTTRALVAGLVAVAALDGYTGCAAIADQACAPDRTCGATVAAACPAALDAVAAGLDAVFAEPSGLDFTLHGGGRAVDSTGNLTVDMLQAGTWTTSLPGTASFTGTRG